MATDSGGHRLFSQQIIKPLESLGAQPYESIPDGECRLLMHHLSLLKSDIVSATADSLPYWDAYVALSYHALYLHRYHIAEKNDRTLENTVCDAARTLMEYCIQRLQKPVNGSFLTLAENVKLIGWIYNLSSQYGKSEVASIFRQLNSATVPAEIRPVERHETDQEEEKKEPKKKEHTVPSVPVVNVKNLISPIIHNTQEYSESSKSSSKSLSSKFSEKYGKKLYWYLCEYRIGDRFIEILKDLPAFNSYMETDISAINFFKGVITRLADARQLISRGEILSSDLDVALHMSKIPLPDCCSPGNLENVCSFGVSCIANTCKLMTALNVVDAQCMVDDFDGTLQRLLNDTRMATMKRAECLTTVYEQLEKSVALNNPEAAKNMNTVALRYFLSSVDGILMAVPEGESQFPSLKLFPFCIPALYLVRHLLSFLSKLMDDLKVFEVPSSESLGISPPLDLGLCEIYTPWYRMVYLMKQHDIFSALLRTLAVCHGQAFSRILYCHTKASYNGKQETSKTGSEPAISEPSTDSSASSKMRGVSLSQEDLILGCLWEEFNTEPGSVDMAAAANAVKDASLTDSLLDSCTKILTLMDREFFQCEHGMAEVLVREYVQAKHILHLLPIMTSNSFEYLPTGDVEPAHLWSAASKYQINVDQFLHNLVTTGLISDEIIITVLKAVGLDLSPLKKNEPWPLYIPRVFLAFFGRVLLKWQFDQQDESHESPRHAPVSATATLTIWSRICVALQQRALRENAEVPQPTAWWKNHMEFEDLNPEHLYLLLLAFHGLALMQKKSVLTQLAVAFVSCACKIKDWNERNLLIVSRILVTIEYLMHRLYEPSEPLMKQVEGLLFPCVAKLRNSGEVQVPVYELAQKVCDILPAGQPKHADLYRTFYYVIYPELTHQDPLTLDGLACSFVLAPNKLPEFADFYQALNTLWNQLNSASGRDIESLRSVATFNYVSLLAWRLLRVLPPSLAHWDALRKDSQEFPLDSVQNITAALWTARLSSKSYKTWLKDTFVKLGLTPLNADLMLSNCTDAVGLNKDVNRLRNFAEVFLSRSRDTRRRDEPRAPDLLAIDASPMEDTSRLIASEIQLRSSFYDGYFVDDKDLPSVPQTLSLVCLVCKTMQSLDEMPSDLTPENSRATAAANLLIPLILDCIIQYGHFCVSSIMNRVNERLRGGHNTFEIYRRLAFVCGQSGSTVLTSTNHISEAVPPVLTDVLIEWQMKESPIQPIFQAWKKEYQHSEAMTFDTFVNSVITTHMIGTTNIKVGNASGRNLSLKYGLNILINFLNELLHRTAVPQDAAVKEQYRRALLPVVMGCFATENADLATTILERVLGDGTFQVQYMKTLMSMVYDILKLVREDDVSADLDPTGLASKCVETFNALMDTPAGRSALAQVFLEKSFDITEIMLSITKSQFSSAYDIMVLNFINRILGEIVKSSDDATLSLLSQSFRRIEQRSPDALRIWMDKVLKNTSWKDSNDRKCIAFLENWVTFIQVTDRTLSEMLAEVLLKALTAIVGPTMGGPGSDYPSFADLMPTMEILAASCKVGHELLLTSSIAWLKSCIQYLSQKEVKEKLEEGVTGGSLDQMVKAVSSLVSYVGRILAALRLDSKRTASPDPDDLDMDLNELDGDEDEESMQGEESEEEVDDSKLCTYTITAKEYMSQHWYHCHTCGLTNGQGMCSVCAKVCHRGHDVTYSKFGSFFCDCGAKEDGSCQALRKRGGVGESSSILIGNRAVGAFSSGSLVPSKRPERPTLDVKRSKEMDELNQQLQEQLDSQREVLTRLLTGLDVTGVLLSLMEYLNSGASGVIRSLCSSTGRSEKTASRLKTLQTVTLPKEGKMTVEQSDKFLQPLVATQEGTFDNVKSSPGEFAESSARSALQHNLVRRRVMAVFAHGAAKYLAMAVEKNKISVYQLSHLLKQVCDRHQLPVNSSGQSGSTKLMLPCHGNVAFAFNVSSVVVNPLREGLLAVTGSKDCVAVLMNPESSTHELITVNLGSMDSRYRVTRALGRASRAIN